MTLFFRSGPPGPKNRVMTLDESGTNLCLLRFACSGSRLFNIILLFTFNYLLIICAGGIFWTTKHKVVEKADNDAGNRYKPVSEIKTKYESSDSDE